MGSPSRPPRLWAIGDLHLAHARNRAALEALPDFGPDWLVLVGDVGDTLAQLALAFDRLGRRFGRLLWVPGNHELWCAEALAQRPEARGEGRYAMLVELCRAHGVLCPEDPWPLFQGEGGPARLLLCFGLYDYSFRPPELPREAVLDWAAEHGILARDELVLDCWPHPSREAWCAARIAATEARLRALPEEPGVRRVLVNHWPLRRDLVRIPRVPRYAPWCGTTRTEDWHRRFALDVVLSGHLHVRSTDWRDGVRFEEVSLGYPRQWDEGRELKDYLRAVLRPEAPPPGGTGGPDWRRWV